MLELINVKAGFVDNVHMIRYDRYDQLPKLRASGFCSSWSFIGPNRHNLNIVPARVATINNSHP